MYATPICLFGETNADYPIQGFPPSYYQLLQPYVRYPWSKTQTKCILGTPHFLGPKTYDMNLFVESIWEKCQNEFINVSNMSRSVWTNHQARLFWDPRDVQSDLSQSLQPNQNLLNCAWTFHHLYRPTFRFETFEFRVTCTIFTLHCKDWTTVIY